jgi:chromosome segregation ATPase
LDGFCLIVGFYSQCFRLREELKNQSMEFTNLQNRLKDSQLALSETQSKHLPAEFELTRLTHEKAQLETRAQSIEEELRLKTKEVRQLHNDFNEKLHTAESRLHGSEEAAKDYLKQLEVYKVC